MVVNPIGNQASAIAALTVVVTPAITVPPTNVIAVAGQTVHFSVTATGTPLAYQWRLSGTNVSGATGSTLTLNNVSTNNAGTYSVTVTNLGGTVTSTGASLAVYATAVPILTIVSETNHQFTLSLAGVPTFNYSVQASSNLVNWTTLTTNASPFNFMDTNWSSQKFYRGQYLP